MDRIGKTQYNNIPWTANPSHKKPSFEMVPHLKKVPLWQRENIYGDFYELQCYIDLTQNISAGKMLDVGAGAGTLSQLFAYLDWEVVACDIDRDNFLSKDGQFVQTDLNAELPFSNEKFDFIACKQVIEHLENPYHLIREFRRILRPQGLVIISTPNIASLNARFSMLRTGLPLFYGDWQGHRTILHYDQLKSALKENGFFNIKFYTNRYEMYNFNPVTSGVHKRFVVPLLKFISSRDVVPLPCKFGQNLIIKAFK